MTAGPRPTAGPVVATRDQVARDHTGFALRNPGALVSTALRTKSVHAREVLAELAWPGHGRDEVEDWARSGAPWPALVEGMDPSWVGSYGQVLALQTGLPDERAAGRAAIEAVVAAGHTDALPERVTELLLQLRVADRDATAARELVAHPAVREPMSEAVTTDLANPALFADGTSTLGWLGALERALGSEGMAPLALLPDPGGESTVFDRLSAPGASRVAATHLVTVLMSSFRPGPPLLTALRSLIEQTWDNLEILVVDDASGSEFAELLAQAERLDPRIRVIRKAVNGGTYRARNTGLRQARGDFFTVLDSDDWLHPQAIEVGVATMLAQPGTMATRGQGVRVSEQLELNRPGYLPRVTSAPSLLVRTHPVLDRIGYFDPTSKSADTEFARRIQAAFGEHAVHDLPVVVTFLRGGDTLSSSEFSRGWRHSARHAYKCAYTPWHQRIASGEEADSFVDPGAPRRFPEPRRWAKPLAPDLTAQRHIDLCLAGDWRRWGGPQASMMEEIAAARAGGLTVAIMHLEAFRFMTVKDFPLCDPVTELVNSGAVEWIHPDDDVDVDVLMIRYPPILQYPPLPGRRTLRAQHVLIMANQAPLEPDGSDQRYVVSDVTDRTRELFGQDPVWVPQGPVIRRVLLEQDPELALTPWDNPGLIDVDAWTVREHAAPGRDGAPVVVGRYSRDNVIKFAPTLADIHRGYDFPAGYEVRMMGAQNTLAKLLRAQEQTLEDLPDNWVVLRHKKIDVVEFLGELDFFLYLDNPAMHEAFGRTILEAAASGVLTIAHPKHEPVFGDTIDYALPGEAQGLIAAYVADPQLYADRVTRSRARVQERFGHQGFVARIRALLRPEPTQVATVETTVEGQGEEGHRVTRQVPLRSAADASRADHLRVVHVPGAEEVVAQWLGEQLALHPGDSLPDALLATAPPAVSSVVTTRDGLVHTATRAHGIRSVHEQQDLAASPVTREAQGGLSAITLPQGWAASEAWSVADPAVSAGPGTPPSDQPTGQAELGRYQS
ncbi:glycosyltransferase [Ornithinimicrobium faecis]|uniref:Glycosyltransferase n=1 Tax=Ornithinimicrobium faecis TaxID=2934158 RepID=A0ABY4YTZ9_9MICO|nr:glycosyltransferase [Ornithinimicrobium sp. HY1793]USQ80057.1 glycosyltransferase [Ornithinimicrobium sp. HY1793]